MSGGKETPRQKMIGMMYLVLTALLALNISKDILNAFITVEDGLHATNINFQQKNEVLYAKFDKAMQENKIKTQKWNDKALDVKKKANELCKMVQECKSAVYADVQKIPMEQADTFQLKYCENKDNYDAPTRILLGATPEEPAADAKARILKEAIIKFRKELMDIVPEKERVNLKLGLNTEDVYSPHDGKKVSWEFNNFDHATVAATMCLLEAVKSDVRNAESDVVNLLLKQIDAGDFKFDALDAKVVAPTSYITLGEKYTADIFVSAHSSTQNPEVVIGQLDTTNKTQPKIVGAGEKVNVIAGVGKYEVATSSEGLKEYQGVINVKSPDGSIKAYPFHGDYMVARPSFAVSPTKMNVFYIGVENPVDITVAGASPTDVVATLSGGNGTLVSQGQGHYTVKVTSGDAKGMINVNVSIKTKTGSKSMGAMPFRVKKVPSPVASFAGITGDGKVSIGELANAAGVIPHLDDFVFDLKFPVVSWNMSIFVNGVYADYSAQGPSATGQMKEMLKRAKTGQKILIEQVKVQAPDGVRSISGVILKVK